MSLSARRAWIEIAGCQGQGPPECRSLSARRAWIEIPAELRRWCEEVVALRKESVDRNKNPAMPSVAVTASLSARRAWIEILYQIDHKVEACRRSPQGERG